MKTLLLLTAALVMISEKASAWSLICQNPGREYNLVYEQGDKAVTINPDSDDVKWKVLTKILNDSIHVVMVDFGAGGPAGIVHLRPYLKVEIFDDGELIQTDSCYDP